MPLASKILRDHLLIPGEPGEWVTLRAVGEKKLKEARQAAFRDLMAQTKGMSEELIKTYLGLNKPQASAEAAPTDKRKELLNEDGYDWDTLCRSAILEWSYSGKPTPAEIEDLMEPTKRWIVRQVLEMSIPSKDDEKNCSSDSTAT